MPDVRHEGDEPEGAFFQRLDPAFGKVRLAAAYCARGARDVEKNLYDVALAEYEKARELGAPTEGCECDPYWGLAALYLDHEHDADKNWHIVHAAKGKGCIPTEFLAHLGRVSGRDS